MSTEETKPNTMKAEGTTKARKMKVKFGQLVGRPGWNWVRPDLKAQVSI